MVYWPVDRNQVDRLARRRSMTVTLSRWRQATVFVGMVLALVAGASACSGGGGRNASSTADSGGKVAAGGAAQGAGPAGKQGVAAGAPDVAGGKPGEVATDVGRDIIYTGSMTERVDSVDAAADQLTVLATAAGGFISADRRQEAANRSTATVELRIPAEKFGGIMTAITKQLGGVEQSRKMSTQDVTSTMVDLDSRIQSQQASVARVRALMAKAESLPDIVSLESQLAQREADLESMQAKRRSLADLTTFSTVTVELLGPAAPVAVKPHEQIGFWSGLRNGWRGFVATLQVLLTVVGALLPFAIAIGVPVGLVLWLLRRRRRAAASGTAGSGAAESGSAGSGSPTA
jgi:hypothetical protein